MKKLVLLSLLIAVFAGGISAQQKEDEKPNEWSRWSIVGKAGLVSLQYGTRSSSWFNQSVSPEFGVEIERTFNPLFGLGLEYMHQMLITNDFTSTTGQVNLTFPVNLANLLSPCRKWQKLGAYISPGIGLGYGGFDDFSVGGVSLSSDGFNKTVSATMSGGLEYNVSPSFAIGAQAQYRWYSNAHMIPLLMEDPGVRNLYTANLNIRYKFGGAKNIRNQSLMDYEKTKCKLNTVDKEEMLDYYSQLQNSLNRYVQELEDMKRSNPSDSINGVPVKDIITGLQYTVDNLSKDVETLRAQKAAAIERSSEIVYFQSASTDLTADSYIILGNLAEKLKSDRSIKIKLEGHTDGIGNEDTNKKLSEQRVRAVKKYLVDRGISDSRIIGEGFGISKPVASNDTPEGRALNRRVVIITLKQ